MNNEFLAISEEEEPEKPVHSDFDPKTNKNIFIPKSRDKHLFIYLDGLRVNKKSYLTLPAASWSCKSH